MLHLRCVLDATPCRPAENAEEEAAFQLFLDPMMAEPCVIDSIERSVQVTHEQRYVFLSTKMSVQGHPVFVGKVSSGAVEHGQLQNLAAEP